MSEILPEPEKRKHLEPMNYDWSHLNQPKHEYMKSCFCVGPANCSDENCPLVKQYKTKTIQG